MFSRAEALSLFDVDTGNMPARPGRDQQQQGAPVIPMSKDTGQDKRMLERARAFPELRYMGSKHRLLPWIHGVLHKLDFEVAADPFVGSGAVAYLLKTMGKRVI